MFDVDAQRVAGLIANPRETGEPQSLEGIVRATLGAGSLRCEVVAENDSGQSSTYVIEREVDSEPRQYLDGVREHADRHLLGAVEIFSQGDLQRIADDRSGTLRLALIDRPNRVAVAKILAERDAHTKSLLEIGPKLRVERNQIATLRQELQPLATMREQLKQAEMSAPKLSPELEAERTAFEERSRAFQQFTSLVDSCESLKEDLVRTRDTVTSLLTQFHTVSYGGIARYEAFATVTRLDELLRSWSDTTRDIVGLKMREALSTLSSELENENTLYYQLRQDQHEANESLKQQHNIRRQVEHLQRVESQLEAARQRESALVAKRNEARASIEHLENQLFDLRIAEVQAINEEHHATVHLTLESGSSGNKYAERISALLSGSRIRAQEDVAAALSKTFPPVELIDVVESGNGQRFADVLDRDLGQMNRVVSHLSDHYDLYTLEADPPSPRLEITMFHEGLAKTVETLSKGQKATALLPLILRPLSAPLIIDQPEDDLDNSFIYTSLIKTVQKLKSQRQIIFVTHNANIPVLGEADQVVVMRMKTPMSAEPPTVGSVDERKGDILDLLEGGAEAFREREAKYHELLLD